MQSLLICSVLYAREQIMPYDRIT